MTNHIFRAKFYGGVADTHNFVIPHFQRSVEGSKRLLASYAHFYINDDVPHAAQPETHDYNVRLKEAGDGCFYYDLSVNILGQGIWVGAAFGYAKFVHSHVTAILNNEPPSEPYWDRREPYFEPQDGGNAPLFDAAEDRAQKLRMLGVRTVQALQETTYPVGRSVMKMHIEMDGEPLAYFDHSTEFEITQALARLNLRPERPEEMNYKN